MKVGWDPTHVQVVGMTAVACRGGVRPVFDPLPPAPQPVAPAAPPAPAATTDLVQPGDSLSKIAKRHGLTLAQLLALNPQFASHPNLINPGEQVVIG